MRLKGLAPLLFCLLYLTATAQRIGNSPYPQTQAPDTLFMVNLNGMSNAQKITVVTLQGLQAKTKPRIMTERGDARYRNDLLNYGIVYDSTYRNDFSGLITHFKDDFTGYILCNTTDTVINAGISICSPLNAIVAFESDTALFNSLGKAQLYDVRTKGQSWAYDTFSALYNKKIVSFQEASKASFLSDYSVFTGAYHFWSFLPIDNFTNSVLAHMDVNSALLGWGDEHLTVYSATTHGIMVHAADFAANLSVYSNMNVPLQQHTASNDTNLIPGKHTVCFVMTDGDNVQWVTGDYASNTRWYGNPNRGTVPIAWTVSPALAELAPTALKYLYDSAAVGQNGDYFVAGPSGMGYYFPDLYTNVDSAADITGRMMQKADQRILTIIGNGYSKQVMEPYLEQSGIDGIFYFTFDNNYIALQGMADCVNGKPVISSRFSLRNSTTNVQQLADTLNAMATDPYSENGYSLVNVLVWDESVDSVIKCVQLLDSNVRVVAPDAFIKLYSKGMNCKLPDGIAKSEDDELNLQLSPNPASDKIHLSEKAIVTVYDLAGNKVLSTKENCNEITVSGLPTGLYILELNLKGRSYYRKQMIISSGRP